MTDKPANLLTSIAIDFDNFLKRSLSSDDEHLKLVVHFHQVSSDFLGFVEAYRSQDSITVENSYKLFAPIWKILGQTQYHEVTWEQMDTLYGSFPYSRLQEIRINHQVQTYPGSTGKSALAQDKWLELNNKKHSSYPCMWTLDGMCHQGNYIGMTQKCKQFLECVYSVGAITKQTVYRSGQGAKGRGQLEKKLLSKVLHIFLGDCLPTDSDLNGHRKLQPGIIASLENHLTIKLDRTKLDKETHINQENDAAGCLFNGVNHIYNHINTAKAREKDIVDSNIHNNIKNIINEAMEYEPSDDIIQNMNEHSFSSDIDEDEGDDDNDDDDVTFQTESKLCIMDLSKYGWEDINKVDLKEMWKTAKERNEHH